MDTLFPFGTATMDNGNINQFIEEPFDFAAVDALYQKSDESHSENSSNSNNNNTPDHINPGECANDDDNMNIPSISLLLSSTGISEFLGGQDDLEPIDYRLYDDHDYSPLDDLVATIFSEKEDIQSKQDNTSSSDRSHKSQPSIHNRAVSCPPISSIIIQPAENIIQPVGGSGPVLSPQESTTVPVARAFESFQIDPSQLKRKAPRSYENHGLGQSLAYNFVPGEYDVICQGRGRRGHQHIGNRRFLQMVVPCYLDRYTTAVSKIDKSAIVKEVMEKVQETGNFVRQDKAGVWHLVEQGIAREKVGQAMRDALHVYYRSSSKSKQRIRQRQFCSSLSSAASASSSDENSNKAP